MFIRFMCHACGLPVTAPRRLAGHRVACTRCTIETLAPIPRTGALSPVAVGSRCPYCEVVLDPPPKKGQRCRGCGQKYRVRQGRVMTREDATRYDDDLTLLDRLARQPNPNLTTADRTALRKGDVGQRLAKLKEEAAEYPWVQIVGRCDALSCPHCIAQHGTLLPTLEVTVEQLPPFVECTCKESGCRCAYVALDRAAAAEQGLDQPVLVGK